MRATVQQVQTPTYAVAVAAGDLIKCADLFKEVLTPDQLISYIATARNAETMLLIPVKSEIVGQQIAAAISHGYTQHDQLGIAPVKPKRRIIEVRSWSTHGVKYDVVVDGREPVSCTCRSFTIQGNDPCKHMRDVRDYPASYGL